MAITPRTASQEFFSDFTKNLEQIPGRKELARVINENAVKESIKNLIQTDRGERLFQPNLGCDIRGSLFESMTPETIIILEENIKRTIRTYEPRCNLRDVEVIGNLDTAELSVRIVFSVINTTNIASITIDLKRVR
jgi:phage baseplate assembly protein W